MRCGHEMTYYEELGLAASASRQEIRKAYRRLSRVLHPDRHPDPETKQVCQCQMQRLNGIYRQLNDPARRRSYDAGLAGEPAEEPAGKAEAGCNTWGDLAWGAWRLAGRDRRWLAAAVPAMGALVAAALAGLWWMTADRPRPVLYLAPEAPASAPAPGTPRAKPARRARRNPVAPVLNPAARESHHGLPPAPQMPLASSESDPGMAAVAAPVEVAREPAGETEETSPGYAGVWSYAASREAAGSTLYPPEYIEAVIVEANGRLSGRYRARYRVHDRAVSPNVSFRFEGPTGPARLLLSWKGTAGAEGDLQLRLISESQLEIAWVANRLGAGLGLAAGTAVLTRRR